MKLYFVRHGQRNLGKNFDSLTPIGIEQSKRVGKYFKNKRIDIVFCSPQKRAIQTLNQIKPFLKNPVIKINKLIRQQSSPEEVGNAVKYLKERDSDFELDKRVQKFLNLLKKIT